MQVSGGLFDDEAHVFFGAAFGVVEVGDRFPGVLGVAEGVCGLGDGLLEPLGHGVLGGLVPGAEGAEAFCGVAVFALGPAVLGPGVECLGDEVVEGLVVVHFVVVFPVLTGSGL